MTRTVAWLSDGSAQVLADDRAILATVASPASAAAVQAALDALPAEPLPVPRDVAAWAAKAVLEDAGLLAAAQAAAEAQGTAWKHRFSGATRWHRENLLTLAEGLGLTAGQLDDMLRAAVHLESGPG